MIQRLEWAGTRHVTAVAEFALGRNSNGTQQPRQILLAGFRSSRTSCQPPATYLETPERSL
jgi:hypothetical protein